MVQVHILNGMPIKSNCWLRANSDLLKLMAQPRSCSTPSQSAIPPGPPAAQLPALCCSDRNMAAGVELQVDGCTLFWHDRHRPNRCRHGRDSSGVALYLRDDLASTAEPILNFSNGVVEAFGEHLKAENLVLIVLCEQPDDLIGRHWSSGAKLLADPQRGQICSE